MIEVRTAVRGSACSNAGSRRHIIFTVRRGSQSRSQFDDKQVRPVRHYPGIREESSHWPSGTPCISRTPLIQSTVLYSGDYIGILACVQTEINKALLYRLRYTRCTSLASSPSTFVTFVRLFVCRSSNVCPLPRTCACTHVKSQPLPPP